VIDCHCVSHRRISKGAGGAAVAALLVPKFGCPLCAPLLAGILGLFGLPFQAADWLMTTMAGALVLVAIYWVIRDRENRIPAACALLAAMTMVAYRVFDMPALARCLSSAAFAAALIWRAWDCKRREQRACEIETESV
jgi:hypothetical protein